MNIRKLLVGTDTSRASEVAVTQAAALAKHLGADMILMYVGIKPETEHDVPAMFATSAEMKRLAEAMYRRDVRAVDALIERARSIGVAVERRIVDGDPASALVDAAVELDADLVVAGTHGRTGIDKFLLGSVADRIVHSSTRPVMVARDSDSDPVAGYRRILVPTDFSATAHAAAELALAVASADAELTLLHCWRLPTGVSSGPASVVDPIVRSVEREIRSEGQQLIATLGAAATVVFKTVRKPPEQGVSEALDDGEFDLVVIGSQGRTGLARFLLGSVATATLHNAQCSVIIVPPSDDG